ncbi:hypothetical protein [Streptomyces stelliscabiei]|uniref:hypothetical protein n=1 Tax=Streptomyces stelliscabiei TaxID=146820 RepID=UPI0029A6C384|nr:hypothetical protein [Streptomyces stelliscabiei]MDX2667378.1 hypothetical protein [Streptomyces stelliscabiei]MDX2785917.1 hypothetical protein [Streptomyces stelliscabiei]
MDLATIGAVLAFIGVLSGSVVTYLGKRGEIANARLNSEMDQIQEERDGLRTQVAARDARIAELLELRLADQQQRLDDQIVIARLRVRLVELRGDPT